MQIPKSFKGFRRAAYIVASKAEIDMSFRKTRKLLLLDHEYEGPELQIIFDYWEAWRKLFTDMNDKPLDKGLIAHEWKFEGTRYLLDAVIEYFNVTQGDEVYRVGLIFEGEWTQCQQQGSKSNQN